MALIHCGECKSEMSSEAASCPNCGRPASKTFMTNESAAVVTTQLTSKSYKAAQFFGVILVIIGVVSCSSRGDDRTTAWMFILGIVIYAGARLGAWWNHG